MRRKPGLAIICSIPAYGIQEMCSGLLHVIFVPVKQRTGAKALSGRGSA